MKAVGRDAGSASELFGPLLGVAFLLASLGVFLLNTRHGIGVLPDSVAYMQLGVARHFAPLYTWLLLGASSFGIDIVAAAKWLGFLLVALNTYMTWRLLASATDSVRYAAIGTALIVSHPVFVQMHAVAMTEPLFVSLFLLAVHLFVQGLDDRRRFCLLMAGGTVGFAMLARFAAAPILAALAVSRLFYADRPFGRRLLDCLLMGLPCILVFGTWLVASELVVGESTGRAVAFRGDPDGAFWWRSLESLSIMLLPAPIPSAIRIPFLALAVAVTIGGAIFHGRGRRPFPEEVETERWDAASGALGLFVVFYAGFLLLSVYIQPYLPLNGRMLLPLYIAAVLTATIVIGRPRARRAWSGTLRIVLAFLAAIILTANLARTVTGTASAFSSGVGYAHQAWSTSPILRAVDNLPSGSIIYSNAPDVITFRLRRHAEYVPSRINHLTGVEDPDRPFSAQLDEMRERLSRADAYVAFIDGVDWRYYLASEQRLIADLSLIKVSDTADGRLYRRK